MALAVFFAVSWLCMAGWISPVHAEEKTAPANLSQASAAISVTNVLIGACFLGAAAWIALLWKKTNRQAGDIRKQASREAEWKQRFGELLENAGDLACSFDLQGNFTFMNLNGAKLLGQAREKFGGMALDDMADPEFREDARRLFQKTLKEGAGDGELKCVTKTGRRLQLDARLRVVSRDGQPAEILAVAQDASKRQIEKVLREKEEFVRNIIDTDPNLIFVKDREGRFVLVNRSRAELNGQTVEEITGKLETELNPSREQVEKFQKDDREVMDTLKEKFIPEEKLTNRLGKTLWLQTVKRPLISSDGTARHVLGVATDITERKRAEIFLSSILQHLPLMIFIKEAKELRFVMWNKYNEELRGISSAAAIGKNDHDFLPKEQADLAAAEDRKVLQGGGIAERDEEITTPHKGKRTLHTRKIPILDENGQPLYLLGISEDITDRRRSEKVREAIYRISQAAHTTACLGDLYREIHAVLGQLMPAENFYIAFHDQAADSLSFPYFVDQHDSATTIGAECKSNSTAPTRKCRRGLTEYVLRKGKALHATPEAFDDLIAKGEVVSIGTRHVDWIGVPLKIDDRTIGIMALQSYTENVLFSDKDMGILQFVSDQAAVAIERKRSDAALAYERELMGSLMDNSPDQIYFKDAQSRFIRCSRVIGERFGLNPEQVVGKWDFDFFSEEHARPAYEDEQEIIRTGQPLIGKIEKEVWKDGRETWVLTSKMPLRNKANEIIGTLGISRDITAIKAAEARLEDAHRQLLESSRLAGMAEVATSVLHNVGNVLNSVNISSSLVAEKVRHSKAANLAKVVALMQEHAADLPGFFAHDPKGRQLPAYLGTLAERLAGEQKEMLQELALLGKNIEHIKEIVAMQQSYARVSGVLESLSVVDLAEDALRMNAGAMERHQVRLVREYGEVPPILVDKHKVLQILVNLIRNAKYALDEKNSGDKQITLRVGMNGNGMVKVSVADNGVGIPRENLTRIFEHGFTTRREGHGFGLHSGALAAREMGGSLHVHSDGHGQGATFTLELPCAKPKS